MGTQAASLAPLPPSAAIFRGRVLLVLMSCALLPHASALGRHKQLSEIDSYCSTARSELIASTPLIFSGPDPWEELDQIPAEMPSDALAFVYASGPHIRWVFLRIVDEADGWLQDVNYYFQDDGSLLRRDRSLQVVTANVLYQETNYYKMGRLLKAKTHHESLTRGQQDLSRFVDPDAPDYLTVDDLPFGGTPELFERLIVLRQRLFQIPDQVFHVL